MSEPGKRQPVGVIGLGLLGAAIARRLLRAGHAVLGHDLDAARCAALTGVGVQAASPQEIAARCGHIVLAVFTPAQAGEVAEAMFRTASPRTLVCTTTCDPQSTLALAARAHEMGWGYIEAPLSGTSAQVLGGEGVGLIGGAPAAIAGARDLISAISPRWHVVGAAGDASRAKLAVNLILGLNRLALAEGLVFAERQGLDGAAFLAIARDSAAYSQVMDTKGEKMLGRDFSAEGRAEQALKDVRMMLAEAARLDQPLPLLAVHEAILEACVAHGEGALDSSVVIEEIRRRGAGNEERPAC